MDQYCYQAYVGLCVDKVVTTSSGRGRKRHICDNTSRVPPKAHVEELLPATADKQTVQQQGSDNNATGQP